MGLCRCLPCCGPPSHLDFRAPLIVAAEKGDNPTLRRAALQKEFLGDKDVNGRTPLHILAEKGNAFGVFCLIELNPQHRADVTVQDNFGDTALHLAAWNDHGEVCTLLCKWHADPNACSQHFGGNTPLHRAVRNGSLNAATALTECRRVNLHARTDTGFTALHYAAQHNHRDIAEQLLRAGADPSVLDDHEKRPEQCVKLEHEAWSALFGRYAHNVGNADNEGFVTLVARAPPAHSRFN